MAMFSAFLVWWVWNAGVPIWGAIPLGMVVSFVMGAAVERFLIRPVKAPAGNPLPLVIVTIGLLLGIGALAPLLFGPNAKVFPAIFGSWTVSVLGASVDAQTIGTLGMLAVEVLVLWVLFSHTKVGLAMRAVASNPESASLAGVPVGAMLALGWGLAAAFGTLAGVSAAYVGLDASLMYGPLIYAFAAATLGGFDSVPGAVLGGLVVGVFAELVTHYVDWIGQDLRLLPAFVLIIGVLLVRPQGLFGRAEVKRV
jgi:branched-chain amino acid transport system permease protein